MRVWLDPHKLQAHNLAVSDVLAALQEQNVEVAAGDIGSAPEKSTQPFTINVRAEGRLTTPQDFSNVIVRAETGGGYTRLGDLGNVELGAEDYSSGISFDGNRNVVGIGIRNCPSANSLQVTSGVKSTMAQLERTFPSGITWDTAFDSSLFVNASIRDVLFTLILSIMLVVGVIYLFLQDPRSTLIPAVTIPVSLGRNVRRNENLRLHNQHDHALRPDPGHGAGRRRCNRRHRKYRAIRS